MEAKIGRFFESVGSFFTGTDNIPWSDRDIIANCEREVDESDSDEKRSEGIMKLSWSLVHSKLPVDVQRGIAMLEASLNNNNSPLQKREKLYLLAIGYYRSGDYPRSRQLVELCLEIQSDWRQAQALKTMIENRITKEPETDGAIGVGIAGVIGIAIAGIGVALARKK